MREICWKSIIEVKKITNSLAKKQNIYILCWLTYYCVKGIHIKLKPKGDTMARMNDLLLDAMTLVELGTLTKEQVVNMTLDELEDVVKQHQ